MYVCCIFWFIICPLDMYSGSIEPYIFSDLNYCFPGLMNTQQQFQSCENLLSENFRLFNIRFLSAKLYNNNFGIFIENISSKKKRLS